MPLKSWNDLLDDAGGAGGDFEPLPDGDYDFVISKSEATQTKAGKTMYKVQCSVENGPNKGRIVFNNFVISPESPTALSIFFRQMNLLGLNREFFNSNPSDHQVAERLKGARFRGQIVTRSFNGQESNEIKQFFTPRATVAGPGASPAPTAAPAPAPAPAAPAPAPAPAFAAPPAAAATQAAPPAPAAPAPAPIQQAPAEAPPAPAAPPVAAPPAPPAPPAAGGDTPPPPPPF